MTALLQIRLLGPLEVERAGTPVPIGSGKQRRILSALALAEGAVVTTERLIEVLWGDAPPASARNSLQTYVARLRDALDADGAIVTRPGGYALDPTAARLDVREFTAALTAARGRLHDDPAAVVARLAAALADWRGDVHGEFDDEVARAQATRLHGQRAEARELLAEARMRCGDTAGALEDLERLLAEDPLRETAVTARARCLATRGRLSDALAGLREHRRRLADELGLDPSPAVDELERQLLRGEVEPVAVTPHDEPAPAPPVSGGPVLPPRLGTETVGRDAELERIADAVAASALVTLVGPGGVGKTRLAAEVARRAPRAAWVDLAPVRRPDDVVQAVVEALGVTGPEQARRTGAVGALRRFPGLVVIDNCEHLVDAVAGLLDDVLALPAEVRILTTSRERLDVAGELAVPVTPLPVPADATATTPAVRLFRDRLVEAGGAPVSADDAAAVAAAVDGLPLAIELAAARAATLPVADLLDRLRKRLDVLAGTRRRRGDRHRTVRDVIGWSYDLLPERERALFRRLAVFPASFRLDDAEQICQDPAVPVEAVADALAHLVECSMVTVLDGGRFRLLGPLRLFAADLLDGEERVLVEGRHRQACLDLAARADAEMTGPDEIAVLTEVDAALPDLRAVHARALAQRDLTTVAQLAGRLYRYAYARVRADLLSWGAAVADADETAGTSHERRRAIAAATAGAWMRDDFDEARRLAELTADVPDEPWAAVTVLESHGDLYMGLGELDRSIAACEQMCEQAQRCGHAGLMALSEAGLAVGLAFRGDTAGATAMARAAVRHADAAGAPSARALAHYAWGELLADTDPDEALEAFGRARRHAQAGGAGFFEGIARTAEVALRGRHGDPDAALAEYDDALALWIETGSEGLAWTTLRNLVVLLVRVGADAEAVTLHVAAERLATKPTYGDEERRLRLAVDAARERLGVTDADAAARAGEAVADVSELTALARRAISSRRAAPPAR